jgi:hypothetical protein
MNPNMATTDRLVRAIIVVPALLIGAYALGFSGLGGIVLFVLAVIMLATAVAGSCPLYTLLRVDARHLHRSSAKPASGTRP